MDAEAFRGKVDFGILTIREDEMDAVLERFPDEIGIASGDRQYNLRRLELEGGDTYTVAIVRCAGQGNGEAQQVANALLAELAPQWLLVVGIGGAAPAFEHTLGDVVVSTEVADFNVGAVLKDGSHEYALQGFMNHPDARKHAANLPALRDRLGAWNSAESVRVKRPGVEITAKSLYGDAGWKKKVRATLEHHVAEGRQAPKVTAGAIACSDLVMKDADLFQVWLKIARQVIAVEMESAGIHRAAHDKNVPFLSIRGLSDVVGFVRDPRWTAYSCHSAAAFARAFLRTRPIAPREGRSTVGPVAAPVAPAEVARAAGVVAPPRPERFVGREVLAERLTATILREPAASAVLLGPAGIGKSTLTLAAMNRPSVVARFGERRWFVRLDTAKSAEAAVGLVAAALGITPRGLPLPEVRAFLANAPGVLALDNLETPWEGERGLTETLLGELAGTEGLALLASVRGAARARRRGVGGDRRRPAARRATRRGAVLRDRQGATRRSGVARGARTTRGRAAGDHAARAGGGGDQPRQARRGVGSEAHRVAGEGGRRAQPGDELGGVAVAVDGLAADDAGRAAARGAAGKAA